MCGLLDGGPICRLYQQVVSANTDKITADDIVAATMNIINATTVVYSQRPVRAPDSATVRTDFSGVHIYQAASQRVPDGVPHYPQHRLGAGD